MPDLHISWEEYHNKTEELAVKVHEDGWEFNQVVCIAKGGMRVGDVFARIFNVPLAILSVESYRGERINQNLETLENATVDDFIQIQMEMLVMQLLLM